MMGKLDEKSIGNLDNAISPLKLLIEKVSDKYPQPITIHESKRYSVIYEGVCPVLRTTINDTFEEMKKQGHFCSCERLLIKEQLDSATRLEITKR